MKSYLKGNVDESTALSTLGAGVLITTPFDETPEQDVLISSLVASYALDNLVAGQGPVEFGIAHSDYTQTEIAEVLDNANSWDQGNKVDQEIAKRLVRTIGIMVGIQGTGTNDVPFNEGKPVKTKLNWKLITGDTLQLWARNISASALTGAPILRAQGHANLWMK